MKKQLFLIVSILVLCIGGCGKSNESSSKESIFESNKEVDAFADVKVIFEGFSGQGTVKIDTSSCDKAIKEHIEFKYDTSVDGKLENEQIITISAVSNNKKYTVLEEEQTYVVNGLFAFAKDIGNYLGDFSDGMAWFRYINPSDGKAYLAYMDSSGKVKFQIDNEAITSYSSFKNGNAMIAFDNEKTLGIIDKSGNILKTIDITKNLIAEANGIQDSASSIIFMEEGWCVVKTEIKDFSNNYYLYTFYNSDGECVFIDKLDRDYYIGTYQGGNVIRLQDVSTKDNSWYFLDGNAVVDHYREMAVEYFDETYDIYKIDTWGEDKNTITLLDNQDFLYIDYIESVDLANYTVSGIYSNDNVMMKHNEKNEVGYYNFETEKFVSTTEYVDQMEGMPKFCGEVIAAEMKGADGIKYIGIFDMNWKLITDPIPGKSVGVFDNGFWISDGDEYNGIVVNGYNFRYYDYSGKLLFESNEQLEFSEGLAYNKNYQWVNTSNEIAIDGMDFSNVKNLQIAEKESQEVSYSIEGIYRGAYGVSHDGEFGDCLEIDNSGNIKCTIRASTEREVGEVYDLTYTKIGDYVWKTSPASFLENQELILYMDKMGNLFVDSEAEDWDDEYFRRE